MTRNETRGIDCISKDVSIFAPLPLQMLTSGHSLSSASGPGHWFSSSLGTGRPESRSKQARNRLWIDTMLVLLLMAADSEELCSREEDGTQGEQGVHCDHSLRMTERKKRERERQDEGVITEEGLFITLIIRLSYLHILSSHTAKSHHGRG